MNKYEKALDELEGNAVQQQSHIDGYENSEYANMNGINKMIGYSQTLQELVDRATPMKPSDEMIGGLMCDKCFEREIHEGMNYCAYCGQAIEWSKDE